VGCGDVRVLLCVSMLYVLLCVIVRQYAYDIVRQYAHMVIYDRDFRDKERI